MNNKHSLQNVYISAFISAMWLMLNISFGLFLFISFIHYVVVVKRISTVLETLKMFA